MNVKEQSEIFINRLTTRKRNPAKPSTLRVYRSFLSNWILPELGKMPVSKVENGVMRTLVGKLTTAELSPSTINGVIGCLKELVASAIDMNGNELYPRTWNSDFIDAPQIDMRNQKTPIISQLEASRAILATSGECRALFALLAGSGLRISEALALKTVPNPNCSYWDRDRAVLVIKTQLYRGLEQTPKTPAGVREIDLDPALNEYLKQFATGNSLFSISIDSAYRVTQKIGVPGFHSFRRFRKTHLEKNNVPDGLMRFWMGHADRDVSDRYVKYGREIESRKEWAQKAGLGFELP